jgi:phosphatidylserine/phosphatidylglycerophosphate/cardiolipin synthase-like enzyme
MFKRSSLDTKLFDEVSFYKTFEKDLKRAKRSVLIESPFLTARRASQFQKMLSKLNNHGVKIVINTRAPQYHSFRLRIQAEQALKILKTTGAQIYICHDMRHRKLAVIDKQILWEGSLNILSQSSSRELMRRTNSSQQAKHVLKMIKD